MKITQPFSFAQLRSLVESWENIHLSQIMYPKVFIFILPLFRTILTDFHKVLVCAWTESSVESKKANWALKQNMHMIFLPENYYSQNLSSSLMRV